MKFNKKVIIIFTMLLTFGLIMSFKTTAQAVSLSVEETTYRGAVVKIKDSKKMSIIKIYQKDNNGNWVKFFEDNNVDATEKSYFISKYRLSTTDTSKLKVIVTSEDGVENTTENDVQKLPDAPDPIPSPSNSNVPSPSNSNSPIPSPSVSPSTSSSPSTSNSPSPSQSNSPTPEPEKKVTKIKIPTTLTIYVDGSKTLTPTVTPKDAKTTLTWSTSNAKVAKVDGNGKVTGIKSGEVTITVKTANGKSAKCKVTVKKKKVTLNGHTVSLQDGNDRVYFLDVSDIHKYSDGEKKVQGSDAIIIESNGKYAMIDVGVGYQGNRVARYLKDIGVKELEWILITHAHGDHYGGLKTVLNTVNVKKIYVKDITSGKSGQKEKYKKNVINAVKTTTNKNNKNITKICDVKNKNNRNLTVGEVKLSLYNTTDRLKNRNSGENVNTVTALAKLNGKKLYFAGDIVNDRKVNAENIAANAVGAIDFYKVSHHSYSPNNSSTALAKLKPKECVVTNTTPSKKPSTKAAHDRIAKYTKTFRYTASGTVILTVAENGKFAYNKLAEDK